MSGFPITGRDLILLHILFTLCSLRATAQNKEYWCTNKNVNPGPVIPKFPESYSMRAEVTYGSKQYVTDMVRSFDSKRGRESIEVWAGKRHVRYLSLADEDAFVNIVYTANGPSCSTAKLSQTKKRDVYTEKQAGPLGVLQVVVEEALSDMSKFVASSHNYDVIRGMRVEAWELCDYIAGLDKVASITLYFTDPSWTLAHQNTSQETKALARIVIDARKENSQDERTALVLDIYSYETNITSDQYFQVPEDVHCPNFSRNRTFPVMPKHFSYQSEKIVEQSINSFVILHSKVYYDYTSKMIRVDSQDTQNKDSELTQSLTTIMDFNTGVKYTINTVLGSCEKEELTESLSFLTTLTGTQDMLDPQKFFSMDGVAYSYIGEYETRGMATDVYSGSVATSDKNNVVHFWYFTPDRTKVIKEEVEKHVLVKVVSRPESLLARKNQTEINFYDFNKERPSAFVFDISVCYNESESKTYVITFPGKYNALLEKNAYVLQHRVHDELWKTAGVSPQRISMQKITFGDNYFFVQFKILRRPKIGRATEAVKKENDLSKAESEIRTAIAYKKLVVLLETNDEPPLVRLIAEPDSLKEFKEDKNKEITFNEKSVAGLSIGMTVLGFLLGGVVVNLIFTRKYGVSLLQKSTFGSDARTFDNPLNESSM